MDSQPLSQRAQAEELSQIREQLQREKAECQRLATALRESQNLLQTILEAVPDAIAIRDHQGHYVLTNSAFAQSVGRSPTELLGSSLDDWWPAERANIQRSQDLAVMTAGTEQTFESEVIDSQGQQRTYTARKRPWYTPEGAIAGVVEVKHETTELKQLKTSFHLTDFAFDQAAISSSWINRHAQIVRVNAAACHLLGYSKAELESMYAYDIDPNLSPDAWDEHWRTLKQQRTLKFVTQHRTKQGNLLPLEVSLHYIEVDGQEYNFAFAHDISKRVQAETALHQSEARLRLVLDHLPETFVIYDAERRFQFVNQYGRTLSRHSEAEFVGQRDEDVFPPAVVESYLPVLKRAVESRTLQTAECTISLPEAGTYTIVVTYVPILSDSGEIEQILGITHNITDRKQAETALQESEEKYRLLFSNELDAISLFWTETGQMLDINQAFIDLYGYSREEVLTMTAMEFSAEPDQTRAAIGLANTRGNAHILLRWHRKKDGTVFPVELCAGAFTWKGRRVMCAVVRDITDRQRAEAQQAALYQQMQQLNASLEQLVEERTAQLQRSLDFEALLKQITDQVRDSLDESQILQTAVQALVLGLGVDCCDTGIYDTAQTTSSIAYEYTISMPTSRGRVVSIQAFYEDYYQLLQGQYFQCCPIVDSPVRSLNRNAAILACPIADTEGVVGDLRLFRSSAAAFDDLEVRVVQQVANQCAIAIRQARLYEAAQVQVKELERLHLLKDDFLSTVSHELRTPMSNIKMATQMLEMILTQLGVLSDGPERLTRYFQILNDECQREINLINDLLDLSRLDAGTTPLCLTAINPSIWIASLVEPFDQRARNQQQQLQLHLPSDLPTLTTDLSHLGRVLSELLHNACKYTPPGETIKITTQAIASDLQIQIINTGVEIAPKELNRIFDKFYRIPNSDPWKHGGTGLGLALVKKLVKHLGGTIWVESGQQQTNFKVQLPLVISNPSNPPAQD